MEVGGFHEQILLVETGLVDLARTGRGIHVLAGSFRALLSIGRVLRDMVQIQDSPHCTTTHSGI